MLQHRRMRLCDTPSLQRVRNLTTRPVHLCIPNTTTSPNETLAARRRSNELATLRLVLCAYASRMLQHRRMRLCDMPSLKQARSPTTRPPHLCAPRWNTARHLSSGYADLRLVLCTYAFRMLQHHRMRYLRHASLQQAGNLTSHPAHLCIPNAATSPHEVPATRVAPAGTQPYDSSCALMRPECCNIAA